MAFRRSVVLSYGVDTLGVVALGGENRQYLLTAFDIQENYNNLSVMAAFRVYGTGTTDLARATSLGEHISALQYLFAHSGDLTLSSDTERAFTGNYTNVLTSPTWTADVVDTSGPGFVAGDVGKHISVERLGSFRIISVSGQTATVKIVPGITNPTAASAQSCRVLKTLILTQESTRTRGYKGRVQTYTVMDPLDTKYRRTFVVEFAFEKPATDTRDLGRRFGNISLSTMPNGLRMVNFSGVYTGSSGTNAVAQYTAQFETWANTIIAALTGSFEKFPTTLDYDDESALAMFTAGYRELNLEESIGATNRNNATIHNQALVVVRQNSYRHGLPGLITPPSVQINYATLVDKTTIPANYRTSVYTAIVRPHLLNQIRSLFGSGDIVILDEQPTFDPVTGAVSVFLNVQLNSANTSPILAFGKVCSFMLDAQKDVRNRWTGKKHKYTSYSPTEKIMARVTVSETRRGLPSYEGKEALAEALRSGGVRPNGGLNEGDTAKFQVPGTPPFDESMTEANEGRNKWNFLSCAVEHAPSFRGRTLETTGGATNQQDLVTESIYMTEWYWGEEVTDSVAAAGSGGVSVATGNVAVSTLQTGTVGPDGGTVGLTFAPTGGPIFPGNLVGPNFPGPQGFSQPANNVPEGLSFVEIIN